MHGENNIKFLTYILYTVFESKTMIENSRDYEVNAANIKLMYPDTSHFKFLVMKFNYVNTNKLSVHTQKLILTIISDLKQPLEVLTTSR
jgi:hypothetical protein